ncbi:MAG: hypothetical protein J0L80_16680 [Chitinophagales bacterium]|nr:hypothetical protein [Chitinophagales bacterium]
MYKILLSYLILYHLPPLHAQGTTGRNHYWQQAWDVCIQQGLRLRTLRVFQELQ